MKYLIYLLLFFYVKEKMNYKAIESKNLHCQDSIKLIVKSPSGSCTYTAVLFKEGYINVNSSQYSAFKIMLNDSNIISLNKNFEELKIVDFKGEQWKDAWIYEVYLNSEKKIHSYRKKEHLLVVEILTLIEKESKVKFIDYQCW